MNTIINSDKKPTGAKRPKTEAGHTVKEGFHPTDDLLDGSIGAVASGATAGVAVGAAVGIAGGLQGIAVGAVLGGLAGAIAAEAGMENIASEEPGSKGKYGDATRDPDKKNSPKH